MSFFDNVKETAGRLMRGGKKQTKRAQLEVQNRQVDRQINKEYARIGKALYPLLLGGQLSTSNAEVEAAVKAISDLEAERSERQDEIDRVMQPEEPEATSPSLNEEVQPKTES